MKGKDTFSNLLAKHYETGFWDEKNPNENYRYVLSDDNFLLTERYKKQLNEIGKSIVSYLDLNERLAGVLEKSQGQREFALLSHIIKKGNDGLPQVFKNAKSVPICKVDIMINKNDELKIAEIDAYNPRGLAYMMMLRDIYTSCVDVQHKMFPGVTKYLSENLSGDTAWIYTEKERYYGRVIQVASEILKREKTDLFPKMSSKVNGEIKMNQMILPFGMNQQGELEIKKGMLDLYNSQPEKFFYPLTPWLGSKGLLGIFSNPTSNNIINLLTSEMEEETLLLKKYLPETVLVGKRFKNDVRLFLEKHKFSVLKEHIASGMKGVWMPNNPNFNQNMVIAESAKWSNFVLQEFVDQKNFSLKYFNEKGQYEVRDDWYVRLIAYVSNTGEIIDAEITARPEPDVHGAKDCLQIPCVF
jgi:hypothetical protein